MLLIFGIFQDCRFLKEINISHFDTSKFENKSRIFDNYMQVTSSVASLFNIGNVKDMHKMFENCNKIKSLDINSFYKILDVSNLNTKNVKDMGGMFYDCSKLKQLKVTNFGISNGEDFSYLFYGCRFCQIYMFFKSIQKK